MKIRWSHPQVFVRAGAYAVVAMLVGLFLPFVFPVSLLGIGSAIVFSIVIVGVDFVRSEFPGMIGGASSETFEKRLNDMRFEFGHRRDINKDGLSSFQILGLGMILMPGLVLIVMTAAAVSRVVASA